MSVMASTQTYDAGGGDKIEVYRDSAKGWRWRRKAANGRITADSGEAYSTKWNAKRAAKREAKVRRYE